MGGCWVSPGAVLTCLLQGLLCKTDQILHGFSLLVGCRFLNLCVCVIASPRWSLVVSMCVLCCRETLLLGWGNDHITACGGAFWLSWAASPCVCLTILLCLRYFAIHRGFWLPLLPEGYITQISQCWTSPEWFSVVQFIYSWKVLPGGMPGPGHLRAGCCLCPAPPCTQTFLKRALCVCAAGAALEANQDLGAPGRSPLQHAGAIWW